MLECTISAYPEPERVQWFRNQTEIKNSPDYQISYSDGHCTLTISEVFPEDAGAFTCTVTVQGVSNSTYMVLKVEGESLLSPLAKYFAFISFVYFKISCFTFWLFNFQYFLKFKKEIFKVFYQTFQNIVIMILYGLSLYMFVWKIC